jgi:hypothetical protein
LMVLCRLVVTVDEPVATTVALAVTFAVT